MKYLDEDILEMREKESNSVNHENIQIVKFHKIQLFENSIEMKIPDNFKDLPKDLAKIKYPMEDRPSIIKSSPDTSVNFAFNLLSIEESNPPTEAVIDFFYNIFKKMQPANRFIDKKTIKKGNLPFGYFDFISPGIDEKIYTLMAFYVLEDRLLQVVFNCPSNMLEFWKNKALDCLESVAKMEDDDEN